MPGCTYAEYITSNAGGASLRGLALEQVGTTRHYYVVGSLSGTGNHGLVAGAQQDGFVARTTDVVGNQPTFDWSRIVTGFGTEQVTDVALDGTGLLATGTTTGGLDVGGGPQAASGGPDAFVARMLAADGSAPVAVEFGTGEVDGGYRVVTAAGTAYVVGQYAGATGLTYQTMTTVPPSGRYVNGFVVSVDATSLAPRWIQSLGGDFVLDPSGIALSGTTLIVAGTYSNDLDLGPAHYNVITDTRGGWLTGLRTSDGGFAWSGVTGGSQGTGGPIAVLPDGRVYWSLGFRDDVALGSLAITSSSMTTDLASVVVTP
jgi:hypothetical protein